MFDASEVGLVGAPGAVAPGVAAGVTGAVALGPAGVAAVSAGSFDPQPTINTVTQAMSDAINSFFMS